MTQKLGQEFNPPPTLTLQEKKVTFLYAQKKGSLSHPDSDLVRSITEDGVTIIDPFSSRSPKHSLYPSALKWDWSVLVFTKDKVLRG